MKFDNLEVSWNVALATSIDQNGREKVNMMTMHASKVRVWCNFLPGWEEGLFQIKNQ